MLMAILAGSVPGFAQVGPAIKAGKALRQIEKQQNKQQPATAALRRFLAMTPQQQQMALGRVPPARREILERRLRRLEQIPPAQREVLLDRIDMLQSLPLVRQQQVRVAIRRLRNMPEARRKAYLDSEDAKQRFDPDELQILRDASGLPDIDER
jgi:hypothetical protein